ncbi:hypothetical protein Poli38472_003277 [Pythium oligandrum]|uniref:NADPH:adrenodoxin oxidoreductase, mitochondrial n=1 Tax=Pythium oligandrum TaxID=41045 RepID=A0A8K1C6B8_PYTOL|nr:hypothetical protein Poli38472_003277 [Pythium oligandrum]|eukprot:TMW57352.1 hypothetical protein Poli38472_003277 [Pythium oligandrum]
MALRRVLGGAASTRVQARRAPLLLRPARRGLHASMTTRFGVEGAVDDAPPSPLRVCVVGAGPAGFYAAKYLLKEHEQVYVDMIEALPTPYGLVRAGVAPDHPEVKSVMNDFEKVAAEERFDFLGNVVVGQDVHLDELKQHYHAVLLAYGASGDRALGIPGEELAGVYGARSFVNWYNGHPSFRDLNPDLSHETVVIFGQGNVAIDCARVLTKSLDELKSTDISQHAIEALSKSKVKKVYVVGRRGSAQAAFTMKEIREITKLPGVACVVDPAELEQSLNAASQQEINEQRAKKRMNELLGKVAFEYESASQAERQIRLKFLASPVELLADPERPDHVGVVRVEKTRLEGDANRQSAKGTGEFEEIPCGLVLRSIGYKSTPINDVPFNAQRHVVTNDQGRVIDSEQLPVAGLYCAGWLKRGPSGIIGSNIVDARETVACIMEDAKQGKLLTPPAEVATGSALSEVRRLVQMRDPKKALVSWEDVEHLHAEEEQRGAAVGKPREKITAVDEMLTVLFGKQ